MSEQTTTARPTGDGSAAPAGPDAGSDFLTARELAEYLNVSEKFVRKHTDAGRLPLVRMGRCIRYRRGEIERRLLGGTLLAKSKE